MAKKTTKGNSHPNFKPLADRVFVKPVEKGEETSAAGIILPGSSEEAKTLRGEVVAVGPGRRDENGEHIPVSVSVGDVILFSRYGYDEVEVAGQEYYFVSEPNILAVVN